MKKRYIGIIIILISFMLTFGFSSSVFATAGIAVNRLAQSTTFAVSAGTRLTGEKAIKKHLAVTLTQPSRVFKVKTF